MKQHRNRSDSTSSSQSFSSAGDSVDSREAREILNKGIIATGGRLPAADVGAADGAVSSRRSSARLGQKRSARSSITDNDINAGDDDGLRRISRPRSGGNGSKVTFRGTEIISQSSVSTPAVDVNSWLKTTTSTSTASYLGTSTSMSTAAGPYFSLPGQDLFPTIAGISNAGQFGPSSIRPAGAGANAVHDENNLDEYQQLQKTYSEVLQRDYDFDFDVSPSGAVDPHLFVSPFANHSSNDTAGIPTASLQQFQQPPQPLQSISPLAINPGLVQQQNITTSALPSANHQHPLSAASSSSDKKYRRGDWMKNPFLAEKHANLSCPFCKRMFKNRNGLRYHVKNAVCQEAKRYVEAVKSYSATLRNVNVNVFHSSHSSHSSSSSSSSSAGPSTSARPFKRSKEN